MYIWYTIQLIYGMYINVEVETTPSLHAHESRLTCMNSNTNSYEQWSKWKKDLRDTHSRGLPRLPAGPGQ